MIKIVTGDITRLEVGAIVNAANSTLLGGGGVDGAIHRAAGSGLLAECARLGGCPPGQSRVTGAYRLPCRRIIHTVGPVWHGGGRGEAEVLRSCYDTALEIAEKEKLPSVAFPCISTGAYGYPREEAARVALAAVRRNLREGRYHGDVTFCCFLEEDARIYGKLMTDTEGEEETL